MLFLSRSCQLNVPVTLGAPESVTGPKGKIIPEMRRRPRRRLVRQCFVCFGVELSKKMWRVGEHPQVSITPRSAESAWRLSALPWSAKSLVGAAR
jgi:hypothetical protein